MFDNKLYWAEKIARSARMEAKRIARETKAPSFFAGLFARSAPTKPISIHHTRSARERAMRRQRHRDRMRNAA